MTKQELEALITVAISDYLKAHPNTSTFEVYLTKKSNPIDQIVSINANILVK